MARGADAKAGFRSTRGPHPAREYRIRRDRTVLREARAELTNQESAHTLAVIVMGFAAEHYELRGWDHIVECYTVPDMAESIQDLIDQNLADIPMRNASDALKWWDGICDAVHESRGGTYGFC